MTEKWDKLDSTPQADYRVFSVRQDRTRSPATGREHDFYVIEADDWVNVIPLTPEGQVVCIRQYRHGTEEVTLEVPGGIIDPGETPADAARREMQEETGYAAESLVPLGAIAPNPAVQDNRCHTFLATGARPNGPQQLDGAEEIDIELVDRDAIPARVLDGQISHALVVVAFYLLDQYLQDGASAPA